MKKTVKILSFLLAVLMLASSLVACGGGNNDDAQSTDAATTTGTVVEEGGYQPLPAMNWEGREYRVLGRDGDYDWSRSFEVYREELPEDVVGKAVYERNMTLNSKYGITVKGTLEINYNEAAKLMLEAGDDLYDLIINAPEKHHPFALEGYLLDLYRLQYINMEHEGWMKDTNAQLTFDNKLFYTTNKFLLQDKDRSWALCYNRDMANELNLGHFEDFVFDGTWTIDKVIELGKQATADSDGIPGLAKGDRWGVGSSETYNFVQLAYGAGFRFTEVGADGFPVLLGASDRMVQILDEVFSLTADRAVYYCDMDYGPVNYEDCADQEFMRGNVLILTQSTSDYDFHKANSDFVVGILPNPKYDENQTEYYTIPNRGNGSLFCVPATVVEPDFAGFCLQAITEESVGTSYEAYIETKCKLQDAHDEDAAKCLDLIFNGVVYDIGFVMNIGQLQSTLENKVAKSQTNIYARLYKSLAKIAQKELDDIKEAYAELD